MIRQLHLGATVPTATLLVMVLWAPIPFGSVLPLERGVLQVAAFGALALVALGGREAWRGLRPTMVPASMLVAVGGLGWLQAMSWPSWLVGWLSPGSQRLWQAAGSALDVEAGTALPMTLSLAPAVSRSVAVQWWAVAAVLAVATWVGQHRAARRLLGSALLLAAVFQVVFGADHWFRRSDTIWGVQVPGDITRLRGTFVNPDHLALYLSMAVALCVAAGWWSIRRQRYELSLERRLLFATPPLMLFTMLFIGLSFTGSRAGLVAVALAVVAQAAVLAFHYRSVKMMVGGVGGLVLGFAGIAFFGLRAGLGRWLETSAYDLAWNGRFVAYRGAIEIWRDFPWFGSGLGTFRQAMPLVQTGAVEGTWTHAHSDYLELLATTGVVGLPLVIYGVLRIGMRLLRVLRSGRRSEDRGAALAAIGALVAAGLASAVDFGLTIPANAMTLAVVVGLACGTPTGGRRQRRRKRTVQRTRTAPGTERSPAKVRQTSQDGLAAETGTDTSITEPG